MVRVWRQPTRNLAEISTVKEQLVIRDSKYRVMTILSKFQTFCRDPIAVESPIGSPILCRSLLRSNNNNNNRSFHASPTGESHSGGGSEILHQHLLALNEKKRYSLLERLILTFLRDFLLSFSVRSFIGLLPRIVALLRKK